MPNHTLCEVVQDVPRGAAHRWVLCADNHAHHHGIVSLSEHPLYLELHWRPTAVDSERPVGVFRLDLEGLLRGGFIRNEPAGSHGSRVRLRVIRDDDGSFYVQTKRNRPRLLLASGAAKMPKDPNQLAAQIVAMSTGQPVASKKNPAAVALGRLGGLKGGKARAAKLSKSKRVQIAKKAAAKRWGKRI